MLAAVPLKFEATPSELDLSRDRACTSYFFSDFLFACNLGICLLFIYDRSKRIKKKLEIC